MLGEESWLRQMKRLLDSDTEKPKRNVEAEQNLICAFLISPDSRNEFFTEVDELVGAGDRFDVTEHRKIYRALRGKHLSGQAIDSIVLKQEFGGDPAARDAIVALDAGVPSFNLPAWAAIVRDCWAQREIIKAAGDVERTREILVAAYRSSTSNEKPKPLSLRELFDTEDEPMRYVVDDLLPEGSTSCLASKPKVGKTKLAEELASCVATGRPFLGRRVTAGRVLYFALEEHRSEVREHFQKMGHSGGEPISFVFGSVSGKSDALLAEMVEQLKPVLVVIDTMQKFIHAQDLNDYAEVSDLLEPLTQIARKSGSHVMFVHHLSKGQTGDEQQILGSTAIFGAVDTALLMNKRSDTGIRTLKSVQRYGRNLEEIALRLDPVSGHVSAAGNVEQLQVEETVGKIISFVAEPESETSIRDSLGGDLGIVAKAIRTAVQDGRLERTGSGKRGSPFLYQRTDKVSRCSFSTLRAATSFLGDVAQ